MKKTLGIGAGVIIIAVLAVILHLNMTVSGAVKSDRILDGVTCSGIHLGGMTKEEAEKAIQARVADLHKGKITLTTDDEKIKTSIESLGAAPNAQKTAQEAYDVGRTGGIFKKYAAVKNKNVKVAVYCKYDKKKFEKQIRKSAEKLVAEPQNATVKRKNGKFIVVKERAGYDLKIDETFDNFKKTVDDGKNECKIDAIREKAKYTTKDVEKIKDVMGKFSTDYSSSPYGRKANVANGAKKINGTVVYPGETFSVYKAVSPFTKKNGYELAGSYENGQTVQTYGGGICQVSTTLYNAVIRAELEIKERHPHSMTVHYVPRSADAAIAGTSKDMKFKNNNDFPIYIEGKADGASITFTVYGVKKDPNRTVEFVSETTSTKQSTGEKQISDPTLPVGTKILERGGQTGYTARLWKIVKINGKQKSKKVFNESTYMAIAPTYRVGTKEAATESTQSSESTMSTSESSATTARSTYATSSTRSTTARSTTARSTQRATTARSTQRTTAAQTNE